MINNTPLKFSLENVYTNNISQPKFAYVIMKAAEAQNEKKKSTGGQMPIISPLQTKKKIFTCGKTCLFFFLTRKRFDCRQGLCEPESELSIPI